MYRCDPETNKVFFNNLFVGLLEEGRPGDYVSLQSQMDGDGKVTGHYAMEPGEPCSKRIYKPSEWWEPRKGDYALINVNVKSSPHKGKTVIVLGYDERWKTVKTRQIRDDGNPGRKCGYHINSLKPTVTHSTHPNQASSGETPWVGAKDKELIYNGGESVSDLFRPDWKERLEASRRTDGKGNVKVNPSELDKFNLVYNGIAFEEQEKQDINQELTCLETELNKKIEELDRQIKDVAHMAMGARHNIKELHNSQVKLSNVIVQEQTHKKQIVEGHNKLVRQVNKIDETKLTKPSVAQELIDAETYMDDYEAVRKEFKTKRFAQKQRIKRKLKRIEEANKVAKKPNRIKHILITTGVVLVAFAAWAMV